MSSTDPFLPLPPEGDPEEPDRDRQPDVLPSSGADSAEESAAARDAAEPDLFRTPEAGDRLTAEQLEDELD